MDKSKKCYNCMTEVNESVKVCPGCEAKLGPLTASGLAAKPGFPFFKILLVIVPLAIAGKFVISSHANNQSEPATTVISASVDSEKSAAIQKIKEKGADALNSVGVADVGYKGDSLCFYVTQQFNNLSPDQQRQLVTLVGGEWLETLGKTSASVKILEQGTENLLAEITI